MNKGDINNVTDACICIAASCLAGVGGDGTLQSSWLRLVLYK